MTPLIDVVFLLLTFFVFSLAIMVRADVLGIRLPALDAARPPTDHQAVVIAVEADGRVTVDGEPVGLEGLAGHLRAIRDERPTVTFFVAADETGTSGDLLRVIDLLAHAGLGEFSMLSRPRRPSTGASERELDADQPRPPEGQGRP